MDDVIDLIGIVDSNGIIQYLSPSHEKVLGQQFKQYEGSSVFHTMHPDDVEPAEVAFNEMIKTKTPQTAVYRHKNDEGDFRFVESYGTPLLRHKGAVSRIVFIGRDITDKIEAEQTLKESWERYNLLQTSLDHFSNDLFGVMKASELAKRLIQEVKEVLRV